MLDCYDDHLTLFMKNHRTRGKNITQLKALLKTLKRFYKISGLAFNLTKTKIAAFGKTLRLQYLEESTGLEAVNSFKLLGGIFDSELENLSENYTKAICAMHNELYALSTRKFSIKGKITDIKTYALCKLNHLVTISPTMSCNTIKEI